MAVLKGKMYKNMFKLYDTCIYNKNPLIYTQYIQTNKHLNSKYLYIIVVCVEDNTNLLDFRDYLLRFSLTSTSVTVKI